MSYVSVLVAIHCLAVLASPARGGTLKSESSYFKDTATYLTRLENRVEQLEKTIESTRIALEQMHSHVMRAKIGESSSKEPEDRMTAIRVDLAALIQGLQGVQEAEQVVTGPAVMNQTRFPPLACDFSNPFTRIDCGCEGIDGSECQSRGCCYDSTYPFAPNCFFKSVTC